MLQCVGDVGTICRDDMSHEAIGLFWPIVVPIAVMVGIYYVLVLIGKGMDKLTDEITKNTK